MEVIIVGLESDTAASAKHDDGDRDRLLKVIEFLFFAYRDFVSDPDAILSDYGFGRAHHRILHFVGRNPGIRVAELLDILRITKQSLGRVLRELIEQGYVYQEEGREDRRQRLLYLTPPGDELRLSLLAPQLQRVKAAIEALPDGGKNCEQLLFNLINAEDREHVARLAVPDRQTG